MSGQPKPKHPRKLARLFAADREWDHDSVLREVQFAAEFPDFANVFDWMELAEVLLEFCSLAAVPCLRRVLQLSPGHAEANYLLACLYEANDWDTEQASKFAAEACRGAANIIHYRDLNQRILEKLWKEASEERKAELKRQTEAASGLLDDLLRQYDEGPAQKGLQKKKARDFALGGLSQEARDGVRKPDGAS